MSTHTSNPKLKRVTAALQPEEKALFDWISTQVIKEQKLTAVPRQKIINTIRFMLTLSRDYFTGDLEYVDRR